MVHASPEVAFRQFVLKIHSRCNLSCDYCYVYHAADQSWRTRPLAIAERTVRAAAERIAEHSRSHRLDRVRVTLHGGEPLLVGVRGLERVVRTLRRHVGAVTALEIGLQTNGILLDDRVAELVVRENLRVGISLDGGRAANDRHRRYAHGASSYDDVVRAVRRMTAPRMRPHFAGLLATVDPANDPREVFHDLVELRPGRIDLLLPHATWESPPPAGAPGRAVYGEWLVAFFDAWYDAPPVIGVRLFEETMHALLGGASRSETVGLSGPESIVIESDGAIERTDALKIAYEGAAATGHNVFEHALDDVLRHPAVAAGLGGRSNLSATCRRCPIVSACGGGLYPHRYRPGAGFDNPSVYCRDLGLFINHVAGRLRADLARRAAVAAP